ncbi:inositol monophosphatase family protein [Demequina oxidasica]|uniref:inositol monophosphatase family protein n=1 Tax=Demequina oxidasica TaxID=676199 RepID=UPI0007807C10|nr:inositol monophosphatase [Demequina oxidasica]
MDITHVALAMTDAADAEIRPRFRALAEGDIALKGPNDYVTEADKNAEIFLTKRLREIVDVPVVGEEATAENPALPDLLADASAAWVVDPVDGTYHFVHGSETYAVMVAYMEAGVATAGWILHPETGDLYIGVRGKGATLNGKPIPVRVVGDEASSGRTLGTLRGVASARYIDPDARYALLEAQASIGEIAEPRMCAGWDYADLLQGTTDYVLFSRTHAWDHAPAAAIVREAGFTIRRLDGSDYLPGVQGAPLLTAPNEIWPDVADALASRVSVTPRA